MLSLTRTLAHLLSFVCLSIALSRCLSLSFCFSPSLSLSLSLAVISLPASLPLDSFLALCLSLALVFSLLHGQCAAVTNRIDQSSTLASIPGVSKALGFVRMLSGGSYPTFVFRVPYFCIQQILTTGILKKGYEPPGRVQVLALLVLRLTRTKTSAFQSPPILPSPKCAELDSKKEQQTNCLPRSPCYIHILKGYSESPAPAKFRSKRLELLPQTLSPTPREGS